ncbi:MAG: CbiX/SirB N-terminal domain-containing protein [Burkholderiaceae bacterium]|nr:CbiX/SirB N-terminal domain-containing protein [Burkholderiaceae bacterium]
MPGSRAIILFGHGSRDARWREPMERLAERIRSQAPQVRVACAYLELTTPDLPDAAASLIAQGADHIRVLPMFLGMGKHVREDLPLLVQALQSAHPGVKFELQPAVGEDERLIAAMAQIALE